jgi:excisionase family DNA binding protein
MTSTQPQPARPAHPTRERYLLTSEVAKILNAHPRTVGRWARQGKLPHMRTVGGHRRFPETPIRALAEAMHVAATTGKAAR